MTAPDIRVDGVSRPDDARTVTDGAGRRRFVRWRMVPVALAGDPAALQAASRELVTELREELDAMGAEPDDDPTLHLYAIQVPASVTEVARETPEGGIRRLRREPTTVATLPDWAEALELRLTATYRSARPA